MSRFSKIITIVSILVVAVSLTLIVRAQDTMKSPQYKLEDSYFEIQRTPYSQNLPLVKKENDQEEIVGQVRLVDQYLISNISENEFLEKFSYLKPGFQDLKISIETDQPLFKKENFYYPLSFWEKTKSLFGFETLPEYRLTKEIKDISENLETNLKIPGLEFKTSYKETDRKNINEEKRIKQKLVFENNSNNEINLQLTLTHSLEGEKVFFGGKEYLISENPQFLSSLISNSVSFSSDGQKYFTYNFSDLLNYNPEVWIFKKGSENLLLVKIYLSIPSHSSIIIDPSYVVDTSTSANATAHSFQRKTWWDGERYWVSFYMPAAFPDVARLEFWWDSDGIPPWTQNRSANIPLDSSDFSIIGDSENLFIIYSDGTNVLARGINPFGGGYPSPEWSWGEPVLVFEPTPPFGVSCKYPHMNRDSSGYIWVIIREADSFGGCSIKVRRSVNENDISDWEDPTTLDDASPVFNKYGVIVPQGSGQEMYAIWIDDATIEGKRYDGGGWDLKPTGIGAGVSGLQNNMSVVHDTTNYYIHLTYIKGGALPEGQVTYREYTDSWQTAVSLDANSSNRYTTISINTSADDLYAFWIRDNGVDPPTYYIYYKKGESPYRDENWDEEPTEWQTTTQAMTWLTSNYSDNNKIYAEWTELHPIAGYNIIWAEIEGLAPPANATPTVDSVILNGGKDITLAENATTSVVATGTVTDTDGANDIVSVDGKIYRSGEGSGGTGNDNYRYIATCATSSTMWVNTYVATCNYEVWFHADPTDKGTYSTQYWEAWIQATDDEEAKGSATSTGVDMKTLLALELSTTTINYGSLNSGSTTGSTNQIVTCTTTGNTAIDIFLYGVDMEKGSDSIGIEYQEYATSTFTYGNGTDATSTATTIVELDLSKPTSHPSTSSDNLYWGAEVPAATPKGAYNGTNSFVAKAD